MRTGLFSALYLGHLSAQRARNEHARTAYWRNAYEELVRQTGRDLNDGLGLDPRKASQ